MSDIPQYWLWNLKGANSEEDFFSDLMDDHTLALLSDLDILLSDDSHNYYIPPSVSKDTGGPLGDEEDYSCMSYIHGGLTELVQPLYPDMPLPVYSKNNNASIEEPCVLSWKRDRHAENETKVAAGAGAGGKADKEKAAEQEQEKEDEDRPKRRRTAEQHSVYERKRRNRIQERLRTLQEMVPNASKLTKSSMLDETIKHIKGLQLHLQMMKEQGLGLLSQCMVMEKMQKLQSADNYHHQYCSTCNTLSSPSGMGYSHGHESWPQMSGNAVFPYYNYTPQPPMFPTAESDGSTLPPVVTAEVCAHVNPLNHRPVAPVVVPAHVSPSEHHPPAVLPPMLPQGEAINYHGPIMPNVQQMQMPRSTTALEFSLLINVPEQLGEVSIPYVGNPVDHMSYSLDGIDHTHLPNNLQQ